MQKRTALSLVASASAGAGVMYFYDPQKGRRRRAGARAKMRRSGRVVQGGVDGATQDLRHRVEGWVAQFAHLFESDKSVPAEILEARVRARIGHIVAHPHAIHVNSKGQVIRLSGEAHPDEVQTLLSAVRRVQGVLDVENALEAKVSDQPGLRVEKRWSPAQQLGVVGVGGLMVSGGIAALRRKDESPVAPLIRTLGGLGIIAGSALLVRSFLNRPFSAIFGLSGTRPIRVNKILEIASPKSQVFLRFKSLLESPLFSARISNFDENRSIYWESKSSASFVHTGQIFFRPGRHPNESRVEIELNYRPSFGLLGHGFLRLLRRDPKALLNQQCMEIKASLERESTNVPNVFETRKRSIG